MKRLVLFLGLGLLLPTVALGVAALTTGTFHQLMNVENDLEVLTLRCDVSGSITDYGTIGGRDYSWAGGETCESGDWTNPVDCRNMMNLSVRFHEYGTGSAVAKVWDCLNIPGPASITTSTAGFTIPGVENPGTAPSASDPDPLCVSLDDAAATVIDGNSPGTQLFNLSDQKLHFIVGELETCTGNCDSTFVISCGR